MNQTNAKSKIIFAILFAIVFSISAFAGLLFSVKTNNANNVTAEIEQTEGQVEEGTNEGGGNDTTEGTGEDQEEGWEQNLDLDGSWEDVEVQNVAADADIKITSSADLASFMSNVNGGHYYSGKVVTLTTDIDMSSKLWTPIGKSSSSYYFNGTFDGAGHKISGITMNRTVSGITLAGLFGYINGATIKNVIVEGVNIDVSGNFDAGGIVGWARSGYIQNCGVTGYIKVSGNSLDYRVGGISGACYSGGYITNCFSYATVISSSSSYAGGISGYQGRISRCFYADGSLSGKYTNSIANSATSISDCYAKGSARSSVSTGATCWAYTTSTVVPKSSDGYILKGVGNIYVDAAVKTYNVGVNDSISNNKIVYIKNIITGDTSGSLKYTADANYNYCKTEIVNNTGVAINDTVFSLNSNTRDDRNFYTSTTVSTNKKAGQISDFTKEKTTVELKFSTDTNWVSKFNGVVVPSTNSYEIRLSSYMCGSYSLTTYQRGKWIPTNFYLKEFETAAKSYPNTDSSVKVNVWLECKKTKDASNNTINLVEGYKYETWAGLEPTNSQLGNEKSGSFKVYVPYNEKYVITFPLDRQQNNNVDESRANTKYLKSVVKLKYYSSAPSSTTINATLYNTTSSIIGNCTGSDGKIKLSGTGSGSNIVDASMMSGVLTKANYYEYYLFDNLHTVILDVNFNSTYKTYTKLTNSDSEDYISRPYFYDSNKDPSKFSKEQVVVKVKANSLFSFAFVNQTDAQKYLSNFAELSNLTSSGNTNEPLYVKDSKLNTGSPYFPYWARFKCTGFSDGSTTWISGSDSADPSMTVNATNTTWGKKAADGSNYGVFTLNAGWESLEETLTVDLFANEYRDASGNIIKNNNNTNLISPLNYNDYLGTVASSKYMTVDSKNSSGNNNAQLNCPVGGNSANKNEFTLQNNYKTIVIKLVPRPGYKVKQIYIEDGVSSTNWTYSFSQVVTQSASFNKFANQAVVQTNSTKVKITNYCKVDINSSTQELTLTLDSRVCVSHIAVVLEAKSYDINLTTSSSYSDNEYPVYAVKGGEVAEDTELNYSTPYTFSCLYKGTTQDITVKLYDGYVFDNFSTTNTIIKYYDKNGTSITYADYLIFGESTDTTTKKNSYITMSTDKTQITFKAHIVNFNNSIAKTEIVLPITRNEDEVKYEVNGIDPNGSWDASISSTLKENSKSQTYSTVVFSLTGLPDYAKVNTITINIGNSNNGVAVYTRKTDGTYQKTTTDLYNKYFGTKRIGETSYTDQMSEDFSSGYTISIEHLMFYTCEPVTFVVDIGIADAGFEIYKNLSVDGNDNLIKVSTDDNATFTINTELSAETNAPSFTLVLTDKNKTDENKENKKFSFKFTDGKYDNDFSIKNKNIQAIRIYTGLAITDKDDNTVFVPSSADMSFELTYNKVTNSFSGNISGKFEYNDIYKGYFDHADSNNDGKVDKIAILVQFVVIDVEVRVYEVTTNSAGKIISDDPQYHRTSETISYTKSAEFDYASKKAGYTVGYYVYASDADFAYNKGSDLAYDSNLGVLNYNDSSEKLTFTINSSNWTTYCTKDYVYIVIVYKAKVFDVEFVATKQTDEIKNKTILNASTTTKKASEGNGWEYGTAMASAYFPIMELSSDMYAFMGWTSGNFASTVNANYNENNTQFTVDGSLVFGNSEPSKITFNLQELEPRTVTYKFADENGVIQKALGEGHVTYGDSDYDLTDVKYPKTGWDHIGWKCQDPETNEWKMYISLPIVSTDTIQVETWDIESLTATLYPVYTEKTCENIKFVSDDKYATYLAQNVDYYMVWSQVNSTDYHTVIADKLSELSQFEYVDQTVSGKAYAEYVYAGYYSAIIDGVEYVVYVNDGVVDTEHSSKFTQELYGWIENNGEAVFTARFKINRIITDVVVENYTTKADSEYSWTYDAENHTVSLLEFADASLSYISYVWKSGTTTLTSNSSIKFRNVSESGNYTVHVKVKQVGVHEDFTLEPDDLEFEISISPVTIKFAQGDSAVTKLIRPYDKTLETYYYDNSGTKQHYSISGVLEKDKNSVTLTAKYKDAKVGDNKPLNITLSGAQAGNYVVYEDTVGQITAYEVEIIVDGWTYKIPYSDDNQQVTLTSGTDYTISQASKIYLQSVLNASSNFVVKTNKFVSSQDGVVYTPNGTNYKLLFETPEEYGDNITCVFSADSKFTIKDKDANALSFVISVVCDDRPNEDIASIAKLKDTNNDEDLLFSDIGLKNDMVGNSYTYTLSIKNTNYRLKEVRFNNEVNTTIISGNTISYTIKNADTSLPDGAIDIKVYVTTLCSVTFDYALQVGESAKADGSTTLPTQTYYACNQTIAYSIQNYAAKLPEVQRAGWIFTGWYNGNIKIDESSVWSLTEEKTLTASYVLADLSIQQKINSVVQDPIATSYSKVYNASNHVVEYNVVNKNETSISYSYAWEYQKDASSAFITLANTTNSLSVRDAKDSGVYKLTITATAGGQSTTSVQTITISISKFNLFETNQEVSKLYNNSIFTDNLIITTPDGDITLIGQYLQSAAGSKLNTDTSVWTIDGKSLFHDDNRNYNFNIDACDENKSIINVRPITLTIEDTGNSRQYNGKVFDYIGTYTDAIAPSVTFDFKISSNSANTGIYNQQSNNIVVVITRGDVLSNFDITVSGQLEIEKYLLSNVKFKGQTEVTYDGKQHTLEPDIPTYVELDKVYYTPQEGGDPSTTAPTNAGEYTVSFTIKASDNYEVDDSAIATLTINKLTIYVTYQNDNNKYTKVYDGTTDINANDISVYVRTGPDATAPTIEEAIEFAPYRPSLTYSFINATACQDDDETKIINISLADDKNYAFTTIQNSLVGIITKRATNVKVVDTKSYDAKGFTVEATGNRIVLSNAVSGETLVGNLVFTQVVNAGEYTYANNAAAFTQSNITLTGLTIKNSPITENYALSFDVAESKLTVNKAVVTINNLGKTSFVYNGTQLGSDPTEPTHAINYTMSRGDGAASMPKQEDISIEYKHGNEVIDAPTFAGEYTYTLQLTPADDANYVLTQDNTASFEITKRPILISFEKEFDYTSRAITYSKSEYPTDVVIAIISHSYYDIGKGDELSWTFVTGEKNGVVGAAGQYDVNSTDVTREIKILRDSVDITDDNYIINIDQEAIIRIKQATITASDIRIVVCDLDANGDNNVDFSNLETLFNSTSFTQPTKTYNGQQKPIYVIAKVRDWAQEGTVYNYDLFEFVSRDDSEEFKDFKFDNTLEGLENINTAADVKYQGEYSFKLALENYVIADNPTFTFKIVPQEITVTIQNKNKVYDGTTAVLADGNNLAFVNASNADNNKLWADDANYLVAKGTYSQIDVGQNLSIAVTLESENNLILSSYTVKDLGYKGNITQKEVSLALKSDYNVYYTNKNIEISFDKFNITGLVKREGNSDFDSISGKVTVKKTKVKLTNGDVDAYNLGTNDIAANEIAFSFESEVHKNYAFSYARLSGKVTILRAELDIAVSDNVKIYNSNAQYATITPSIHTVSEVAHGEIVGTALSLINIEYYANKNDAQATRPANAGTYYIKITVIDDNYILYADPLTKNYFHDTTLIINKRAISLTVDSDNIFPYCYGPAQRVIKDSEIGDPTENSTGGLVESHNLRATLETNRANAGMYRVEAWDIAVGDTTKEIYPLSIVIIYNDQDVTANYTIKYVATFFIVATITDLDTTAIDEIVYTSQKVTDDLDHFFVKFKFEGTQYTIKYGQDPVALGSDGYQATLSGLTAVSNIQAQYVGIDAGSYTIKLVITNTVDETLNLADRTLSFDITQKDITVFTCSSYDKYYDGNSSVINTITSSDVFESDRSGIEIVATYVDNLTNKNPQINAGGPYELLFTITDLSPRRNNYNIVQPGKTGEIKRQPLNMKFVRNTSAIYYTGVAHQISIADFDPYREGDDTNKVQGLVFGGYITINEVNSNTYQLSTLYSASNIVESVTDNNNEVFKNYEIVNYTGTFTILPCEVKVTISNRQETYNAHGQRATFEPYAVANKGSILEAEKADLLVDKYDALNTLPVNAGTYAISFTINSRYEQNYTLIAESYGNFTIEKKDIRIVVDPAYEISFINEKVQYTLSTSEIDGILPGHDVAGYLETNDSEIIYEANNVVGVYDFANNATNPTHGITLKDFDILENEVSVLANYNLTAKVGQIKIKPVVVDSFDTAHLVFTYSATDYMTPDNIWISAGVQIGTNNSPQIIKIKLGSLEENGGKGSLTTTHTEMKDADTYFVYLTIVNTSVVNREFEVKINKKTISTLSEFTADKIYDGRTGASRDADDPSVSTIESDDICLADKTNVTIFAQYVEDANAEPVVPVRTKGVHDIVFNLSGTKAGNYELDLNGYTGEITAYDVYVNLKAANSSHYYTNTILELNASDFEATGPTAAGDDQDISNKLSGLVKIRLFDANVYNLAENAESIDFKDFAGCISISEPEYNIVGVKGTLTILRAQLQVAVSNTTKTYNGQAQYATFNPSIYSTRGAIHAGITDPAAELLKVTYTKGTSTVVGPVNVGEYSINISINPEFANNYTFAADTNPVYNFVEANNTDAYVAAETLTINKLDVSISIRRGEGEGGLYYTEYSGSPAEYTLINNDIVTILAGHTIYGKLVTNGKKGGMYELSSHPYNGDFSGDNKITPKDIAIKSGTEDVTANYNITNVTAKIFIKSKFADHYDTSALDDLYYEYNEDKIATHQIVVRLEIDDEVNTYIFGQNYGECVWGNMKVGQDNSGTQTLQVVDAGQYTFTVKVTRNDTTLEETINFSIKPKIINSIEQDNITKIYDGTNVLKENFNTLTLTSTQIGDEALEDVHINAVYSDVNVGNDIEIIVTLTGTGKDNYVLADNFRVKGDITSRNITISVKADKQYTYKNDTIRIPVEHLQVAELSAGIAGLAPGQGLSGFITLNKKEQGTYDFIEGNLITTNMSIIDVLSSVSVISNYTITYAGEISIDAREVSIAVEPIDFTYNTKIRDITPNLTLTCQGEDEFDLSELNTLAQAALNIEYDNTPIDAGNYTATISSLSHNFVFTTNEIEFTIKKRDIQINIGAITYEFNNYSDHKTDLTWDDFVITYGQGEEQLAEQTFEGYYKLNKVGAGAGTYFFNTAETKLVIEDFRIYVGGEDVLSRNYNLNASILGSLTITKIRFTADDISLGQQEIPFIYNGKNRVAEIIVLFEDSEGIQKITRGADSYPHARFTILDGKTEIVNYGTYRIQVEIDNYEFENEGDDILTIQVDRRKISTIALQNNKTYNGNAKVYSRSYTYALTSPYLVAEDNMLLSGYYTDSHGNDVVNVGNDYNIRFVLSCRDESLTEEQAAIKINNYQIDYTATGSIIAKKLTIVGNKSFAFKSNGSYSCDANTLTPDGLLKIDEVEVHELAGQITLTKPNYIGDVNASEVSLANVRVVEKADNTKVVTNNYSITFEGVITIGKASLVVSYANCDNTFEYDAQAHQVHSNAVVTVEDNESEVIPNGTYTFRYVEATNNSNLSGAPKDVGSYKVVLDVDSDFYTLSGNTVAEFAYTITQADFEITLGDELKEKFSKYYGDADPTLEYAFTSQFSESIIVKFTREAGESIRKNSGYDVQVDSWNNSNYNVILTNGDDFFEIKKAGILSFTILNNAANRAILQKVYDNSSTGLDSVDIEDLEIEVTTTVPEEQVITGTIAFGDITSTQVGSYALTDYTLENDNYGDFAITCDIDYLITAKRIEVVGTNLGKVYDSSTKFNGTLTLKDLDTNNTLDSSVYPLTVSGVYQAKDFGTQSIVLTYTGDSLDNYDIKEGSTGTGLAGTISARTVTIVPDANQSIVYGTTDYTISYTIQDGSSTEFYGELEKEVAGNLKIDKFSGQSKYIVGEYTISRSFEGDSDNFNINVETNVKFNITEKQLVAVASEDITKIYDETTDVEQEITLENVVSGDVVGLTAKYENANPGPNKVVIITLTGADAGNYVVSNLVGEITERIVILNYVYEQANMYNPDLITNNVAQSSPLIYGEKISESGSLPEPMHEGYTFVGWYLESTFETQITDDTTINSTIWDMAESEKTVYAKWTIKTFSFKIVVATRSGALYQENDTTGCENNSANAMAALTGNFTYCYNIPLSSLAVAADGFKFIGFSDAIEYLPKSEYITDGYTIKATNNEIYAKFEPLMVKITLTTDNGVFERIGDWTFDEHNTTAVLNIEFNGAIGTPLPKATKVGYTQQENKWSDGNSQKTVTAETLVRSIMTSYAEELNLVAVYEANKYDMILVADGGYFETTSGWTVVTRDTQNRATTISKKVTYDQAVGQILEPTRLGYTFTNWTDGLTSELVWTTADDATFNAVWEENTYELTITSDHGTVDIKVYNADDVMIAYDVANSGDEKVLPVKTTNIVVMSITVDQGYEFDKWTSGYAAINNSLDMSVRLEDNFYDNYEIEVVYTPRNNTITLLASDPTKGTVEGRVGAGEWAGMLLAKTEQTVQIKATPKEGYEVSTWVVSSSFVTYELSGDETDLIRVLSGFVDDVNVVVMFRPAMNTITIETAEDKGQLVIGGVEFASSYDVNIRTEQTLQFTIVAKHGYRVSLRQTRWTFTTSSENKGNFDISSSDEGYSVTITFTGFTSSGTITVPFEKDRFTITIGVLLKDVDYTQVDEKAGVLVLNDELDTNKSLDVGGTFTREYESVVNIKANNVFNGYTFTNFSLENNKVRYILAGDGLVEEKEDGSLDIAVLDSITIYIVYEIKTYNVTYSVNDEVRGSLTYNGHTGLKNCTLVVKYGYETPVVTAATDEYYQFVRWVKIGDDETQTPVSTDAELVIQNITADCRYMAIFQGKPLEFEISVELPESDIFTQSAVEFGDIRLTATASTTVKSRTVTNRVITYIISTYTGENISFEIVEKTGYEFNSVSVDPRVYIGQDENTVNIYQLNIQTKVTVQFVAKVYEVKFKLTGKVDGADIFEKPTSKGIVSIAHSEDGKTLILGVKTGGDAQSILYTYFGYSMVDNSIFVEEQIESNVPGYDTSRYYNGSLSNITDDTEVEVEIRTLKYYVTFYVGDEAGTSFSSEIEFGQTEFNPALPDSITAPTRTRYVFQGYNTSADYMGITYNFNNGVIYTVRYDDNVPVEVNGFKGSTNITASTRPNVDYDCNVYAEWALETHKITLVFVPEDAITSPNIVYTEVFPNVSGRRLLKTEGVVTGVAYEPGSRVLINSPATMEGYTYYGWAMQANITDKNAINVGLFNELMEFEDIVVYLYYVIDVDAIAQEGGTATISSNQVLYGEQITLQATVEDGYEFGYWLQNTTQMQESALTMRVVVTSPTTYYAVFIGKAVEVRLGEFAHGKVRISESTLQEVYRVGSVILLELYDIEYGYMMSEWNGEFSGEVTEAGSYKITAEDQRRGYVKFGALLEAQNITVQFLIDGKIGGVFVFEDKEFTDTTKTYKYGDRISFMVRALERYQMASLQVNETILDSSLIQVLATRDNGFVVGPTNVLLIKYRQMLWIDVYEMFGGRGTKDDPYIIQNEKQLAAMAYLINNGIESKGTMPYAQGHYIVRNNLNLVERFWQPIGTASNPFDGTFEITDFRADNVLLDKAYSVTYLNGLFGYITDNAIFIIGERNYSPTLTIILVAVGTSLAIAAIVTILVVRKRRRMRMLSNQTSILSDDIPVDSTDEISNE